MAPQFAYLGLGNMGQAMSKNLVQKGNLEKPLILWNRTSSRAHSLSAKIGHSIVVDTVEDAVRQSDIIWSCFMDTDVVRDIFQKILKCDIKGKLFVECSTINSSYTNELAADIEAAGGEIVAMPVFGEPSMAEAGILTCVPAGKAAQVERVKPYCVGVVGRAVIDYSDQEHGKASLLKLIGNVFIVNMIETIAEGLTLAEQNGLGVENLQKMLGVVFPGPYLLYSKHMISGGYYKDEPKVAIGMAQHLASDILEMARKSGTSLRAYEAAYKHMDLVYRHTGYNGDIAGIYGAVRMESGLAYENQPTATETGAENPVAVRD